MAEFSGTPVVAPPARRYVPLDAAAVHASTRPLVRAIEELGALVVWYERARHEPPERRARRVLIAGVRVIALRLVGSLVGRDPCRTFRLTTDLSERLYARARSRYRATGAAPPRITG